MWSPCGFARSRQPSAVHTTHISVLCRRVLIVCSAQATGAVAWVSLLEGWQEARASCVYEAARPAAPDAAQGLDNLLCAGLFDLNAGCKRFGTGLPEVPPEYGAQSSRRASGLRRGCSAGCAWHVRACYRCELCC